MTSLDEVQDGFVRMLLDDRDRRLCGYGRFGPVTEAVDDGNHGAH
jgi:hypothetical protein